MLSCAAVATMVQVTLFALAAANQSATRWFDSVLLDCLKKFDVLDPLLLCSIAYCNRQRCKLSVEIDHMRLPACLLRGIVAGEHHANLQSHCALACSMGVI